MAICNSCGGIIGIDCFNPGECAWITERMEQEKYNQQQREIYEMEQRIAELETKLKQKARSEEMALAKK